MTTIVPGRRSPLWILPVVALLAVFLSIGFDGIDFGYHWDEPLLLNQLQDSIEARVLLPIGRNNAYWPSLVNGDYEYPMVLYWTGIAAALPDIIHRGIAPTGPAAFFTEHWFKLRYRGFCLAMSSLLLVWVWRSARRIVTRPGTAVLAAGFVVGSWEFAYHARFIATDTLMAQFAGATMLLCLAAIRSTDPRFARRWLIAAAVVAGIGTATKYPGGLLTIPLLAAAWSSSAPSVSKRSRLKRLGKLFAVQIFVFLVITPGVLLQPWNFGAWVWYDHMHYSAYGHWGHTIHNPIAHFQAIVEFLSLSLFSPITATSIATAFLFTIGAIRLIAKDRRAAAVVLIFPAFYILYFCTQIVELVRNLLVLVPFLAVAAAVGADLIFDGIDRLRPRARSIGRWTAVIVLIGMITASVVWQCLNVRAIRRPHGPDVEAADARAYLLAHSGLAVYPTEQAAKLLGLPLLPTNPDATPVVIGFSHEDNQTLLWPSNMHHYARAVFGSPEVNFDDYPDWAQDSIVLLDLAAARRVPSPEVERAVGRRDRSIAIPRGFALGPFLSAGNVDSFQSDKTEIKHAPGKPVPMPMASAVSLPDGSQRWTDPTAIVFDITGLDPARPYTVCWTWWNTARPRRSESVWIEPTIGPAVQIRPATTLPDWTADQSSWKWPPPPGKMYQSESADLPSSAYRDGKCRLNFRRESGPDATVSSVWIVMPGK